MLYLHWPFGHVLGEPGNHLQQRTILHDELSLAQAAPFPGLVVDLPYPWKRQTYLPISDWPTMSDACAQALHEAEQSRLKDRGQGRTAVHMR